MNLKVVLLVFFIVSNSLVWFVTETNKNQKISITLNNDLKQLQKDYETLKYHQQINNKVILRNINSLGKDVFNQLDSNLNKDELFILRKQLYTQLQTKYKLMKLRGVYQVHFVLPDNKSFLRLHSPSKFGDDLSGIRYSYEYVNKHHISIEGFEGGKITGSYRNVYPLFNSNGKYVGLVDIAYTSDYLQNYLTIISKLHTHFLVNKTIFDTEIWKTQDKELTFKQSAEHDDFMLTLTKQHTVQNCIVNNIIKLVDVKQEIASKMKLAKPFAIHSSHPKLENEDRQDDSFIRVETLSFYPVKSTEKTITAWLVSYKKSDFIEETIVRSILVRVAAFILFGLILYILYKYINQQNQIKEQHQILEKKTKQLNDFIHSTSDFLWEVDINGNYTYVSDGVENILGYTEKELIGKSPFEFMDKKEVVRVSKIFKELLTQEKPIKDLENTHLTKDGKQVYLLTNGVPMYSKGKLIGYRGTDKDISMQIEQQKIINEQSKNASMGEMIGNIAHQWRQPLSIISSGATGMKMQKEFNSLSDEQFVKTCDTINENAQYLSKTIDDFRNFIKGEREFVKFNLKENIESFLNLVQPSLKRHNIHLVLHLDGSIELEGYPNELTQCFINIFNNARDVLKDSSLGEKYLIIVTMKKEDTIEIKFTDNAGGIAEENLPKIFEPYFTTKHQSQGTGLGLHMTYNLITEGMKGSILASNVTFKHNGHSYNGAEFKISLPLR